eukprot:CAMPEP_0171064072 /NCGR_PEP_ID=MMETSP0766_2-20121228/6058_1 /TAXON_ID=439317 /ORGANISM="Gambierdiscus australes, Strain CAWD 149" /LENGTH=85 /DNA_ID=CAMNT_0011520061 /DNA_START=172 /DNA_END=430 /DNA_ORIENTATION=-
MTPGHATSAAPWATALGGAGKLRKLKAQLDGVLEALRRRWQPRQNAQLGQVTARLRGASVRIGDSAAHMEGGVQLCLDAGHRVLW